MKERIQIEEEVHGANDRVAEQNRRLLDEAGLFSLNVMASPGAGKTSLLEQTIAALKHEFRVAVIDGDIATSIDADRAAAAGATAVQINTGGGCHLEGWMVRDALARLPLADLDLVIVENVGNLVCPSGWALGAHRSVLVASVPEGDDKPYKYPGMYRGVDTLVINKIDLLPYVSFNMDRFRQGVETLNPGLTTFALSCRTGEGVDAWTAWLLAQVTAHRALAES